MIKRDNTSRLVRSQAAAIRNLTWQIDAQDRARMAAEEEALFLRKEVHLLKCYDAVSMM